MKFLVLLGLLFSASVIAGDDECNPETDECEETTSVVFNNSDDECTEESDDDCETES